jgi:hypothetical protein
MEASRYFRPGPGAPSMFRLLCRSNDEAAGSACSGGLVQSRWRRRVYWAKNR